MLTIKTSLILVWCCIVLALCLIAQGGLFIALGHLPIAGSIFLRRHIRSIARLKKPSKQTKMTTMAIVIAMIIVLLIGAGVFTDEPVPVAQSVFKIALAAILSFRLFNDSKLFMRSRAVAL